MGLITETKCLGRSVTGCLWRGTGLMRSNENTLPSEEEKICYAHMLREIRANW